MLVQRGTDREKRVEKRTSAAATKQSNESVKREEREGESERERGANAERKSSLIKDKGISGTSRLVVTTTSASHSLQRPLSEKPSSSSSSPLSFTPRVPSPAAIHRGRNPTQPLTIQYDPTQ